jgi:hypothetical protein
MVNPRWKYCFSNRVAILDLDFFQNFQIKGSRIYFALSKTSLYLFVSFERNSSVDYLVLGNLVVDLDMDVSVRLEPYWTV